MHLTSTPPIQITTGTQHHGFTSCTSWRGWWYVAYRRAESHWPAPPGHIDIRSTPDPAAPQWPLATTLVPMHGDADLRDPKLLATPEALYCLCGGYLPRYPRYDISRYPAENIMQSFLTYTEDGCTWAPLRPIFRPNYWIWSVIPLERYWVAAAYHTGGFGETSSIQLLSGTSLLTLMPHGVMYDGGDITRDGPDYRHAHATVSEPVLYEPSPGTLACCLRTEGDDEHMEIGVSRFPYQRWHWWNTKSRIHPSAVIETPYGWMLAGREIYKPTTGPVRPWNIYTSLFHLDAQDVLRLSRLPSALDTGYAGLCEGVSPNQYLCSWYSQHASLSRFGKALPGAHVFVSTLTISP